MSPLMVVGSNSSTSVDARGLVLLGQDCLVQLEMKLYYHSAGKYKSQLKIKKTADPYLSLQTYC